METKDINKNLKQFGYKKLNAKYGVSIYIKKIDSMFSQAILVASPTPKVKTFDFEIGVLNLHLENAVLEIEQTQFVGVYSLHYGWKVGEISGKDCLPDEIEKFYRYLGELDSQISNDFEKINRESTESLTSFRDNMFFSERPIRKYGSYEAFRGVIYSVIENGYLDPLIENNALSSLSSDPTEYKQLEFKLGILKKHIALKAEGN